LDDLKKPNELGLKTTPLIKNNKKSKGSNIFKDIILSPSSLATPRESSIS